MKMTLGWANCFLPKSQKTLECRGMRATRAGTAPPLVCSTMPSNVAVECRQAPSPCTHLPNKNLTLVMRKLCF